MILFKNSKFPSSVFFVQEILVLSFHNVVFSIGGFLDDKNVIFNTVKNWAYFQSG